MATDLDRPYTLTPTDRAEPDRSVATLLDPDGDELEVASTVWQMVQTARAARQPMVPEWNRSYRALRCRPSQDNRPASWEPNIRIPELWPIVRASVTLKLDQRIVSKVSPAAPFGTTQSERLAQLCSDLEAVMESTHFVNREETQYERMLWNADTYGTGILKTVWDPVLADGKGDAVIRSISPYNFLPDPAASDETDGDYYIELYQMSLQQLDRKFPGKGELFSEGTGGGTGVVDEPPSQLSQPQSKIPRVIPGPVSPATAPRLGRQVGGESGATHQEPVTVAECWIREHDVDEIKGGPDDGLEVVTEAWRVVVVANGRHVLMNERADELWGHGEHPYSRFVPHDLGEFWGVSLVQLLGPCQAALNRILQSVQRHIELTGNPILLEDYGSMMQGTQLKGNKAGERASKRKGTEVGWMEPPNISPQVPEFIRYILSRMEAVSGLSALARGGVPQGRPAEGVVDALQEVAFVSIRGQLRNLESTLRDAYVKKAALVAEFYTEPRWLSITGPQGEPSSLYLSARHFMEPNGDDGELAPLEYQIRVDAGSSSHTSRKVREDKATQLFTLGAISTLDLLEALEWPNPHLSVKRKAQENSSVLAQGAPGKRERARA